MDNVNLVSIKGNNCYLPWMERNTTKAFFRTQTTLGDSEKLCGWDLLTHGGFLTYPHHDAAGHQKPYCKNVNVRIQPLH